MFTSTISGLMNQGLVENQEIMVTSHVSFDLQNSHHPLNFSPYGLQNSLNKTCTVGGGEAGSHLKETLPPLPSRHGDVGTGHLGGSSAQRSTSDLWVSNDKGSSSMVGFEKPSNNKNSPAANNNAINSLSVGAIRMKKVKARRKMREPRFCFKTMSEVDVLDDGYKWRKYGQKVVKNTQQPRSYYRCTQESCRVKKKIERLAEDPRMVITTYEGRHVHSPSHDEDQESQPSSMVTVFW